MSLERRPSESRWSGTVPSAFDARILLFVAGVAALAASLNVPYGGPGVAVAAFAVLAGGGAAAHLLGERRLRRLTDDLLAEWSERGGRIEAVTDSTAGAKTEWVVHTPDGTVTIGGLALAPISRLTVEWDGISEGVAVSEASSEGELERLAAEWHAEIFDGR